MAKHIFSILCESASVDSVSNGLTLSKIIEEISISPIPEEPALAPASWTLVTLAARTNREAPETQRMRADLVFPDGSRLEGPPLMLDLTTAARTRQLMGIQGIMIKGTGDYTIAVYFDENSGGNWLQVGEWVFTVSSPATTAE
jgi:hypothetical protein